MRAASTLSLVSPRGSQRARRSGETSRSTVAAGERASSRPYRTRRAKRLSRAERKTSRTYVTRVRGGTHHANVVAKMPAPSTSTRTLSGRRAAARVTRLLSAGERGAGPSRPLGPWRSGSIVRVTLCLERYTDRRARLQPESVGGVALVYSEAQPPVRVWYEHQLSRLG